MRLSKTLDGPTNATKAQTRYSYGSSVSSEYGDTSIANHEAPVGLRANLLLVENWRDTDGAWLPTTNTYDAAGNLLQSVDPGNHPTQFEYTDRWSGSNACGVGTNSYAYVTVTVDAAGYRTENTYFRCTGELQARRDSNDLAANRAGTTFTYDSINRLSSVSRPDGGNTSYTYGDSGPFYRRATTLMATGQSADTYVQFDGLGRVYRTLVHNGESGVPDWDTTDTCYGAFGRQSFVSYPFQAWDFGTPGSCSGAGDSFAYDALSRLTTVTHSDGTTVLTSYAGRATKVQDEGNGDGTNRVQRISQVDGLGRLAAVCEVTSNTLPVGVTGSTTPSACNLDTSGTGFLTSYTYDVLGNLNTVNQGPLTQRSFTYDSLSRLTDAVNPESGHFQYAYDPDGNVTSRIAPAPNHTDSSTATTTYAYDVLHRLLSKTYTGNGYTETTPALSFAYDQSTQWGSTVLSNPIGRKTWESVGSGTAKWAESIFAYDPMGRLVLNYKCSPRNCGTGHDSSIYTYDKVGNMLTKADGVDNIVLTASYNLASRITQLTSSLDDDDHPPTLLSNAHYNAFGQMTTATLGNGLIEARTSDSRGRFTSSQVAPQGGNLVYRVEITNYAGNGNPLTTNEWNNGSWTYGYDDFNRLASSTRSDGLLGCVYLYDRFGNRWQQNNGSGGNCYTPLLTFNANNRIVGGGYTYDAAGNLTADGNHTYTYDAENRITQVDGGATATYVYDAEGQRVRSITASKTLDFVYDYAGRVVGEYDSGGGWTRGEVFAGNSHLASYVNSTTLFTHGDWLGTQRVRTNVSGGVAESFTSLPFGDGLSSQGSSPLHFTGKERDSETQLDYFGARYYGSTMGRFASPDRMYFQSAMLTDPQRFNLYAYTRNNPLRFTDPSGEEIDLTGDEESRKKQLKRWQSVSGDTKGAYLYQAEKKDKNGKVIGYLVGIHENGADGKAASFASTNAVAAAVAKAAGAPGTLDLQFVRSGTTIRGITLDASHPGAEVNTPAGGTIYMVDPDQTAYTPLPPQSVEQGGFFSNFLTDWVGGGESTPVLPDYVLGHELAHGLADVGIGRQGQVPAIQLENKVRELKDPSGPKRREKE